MKEKAKPSTWYVTFRPKGKTYLERRTVFASSEGEARDVIRTEWPDADIKDVGNGHYTYCARGYKAAWKEHGRIHTVWHDFTRRFLNGGYPVEWRQLKPTGKGVPRSDEPSWWGLMCAVERWVERNAKNLVRMVGADDDCHMCSDIVLVPHETDNEYWGTTCVFLEQGKEPREFFLYPGHLDSLVSELLEIQRRQRAKKPRELLRDSIEQIRRACNRDKSMRLSEFKTLDYTLWSSGTELSGDEYLAFEKEAEKAEKDRTPPTW